MRVALVGLVAAMLSCPSIARAHGDYDVQSSAWNGLDELVRIAQQAEVELRPVRTLDWAELHRGDGLLVLYPLAQIDRADVTAFLEDGGRVGLFDDFGDASPLFSWFGVARSFDARGTPRAPDLPSLLVARRRTEHALAEGVDALVTNVPAVISHPRLQPIFELGDDARQGVVLAGEVNTRGRLVIGSDPSVLINSMLRFPGNRRFARNLLVYLAGRPHGRVWIVHSGFATRGVYQGRAGSHAPQREFVRAVNEALARLSNATSDAPVLHWMATLVAVMAVLGLGLRAWGTRPSDRFGPTGPTGAAAGLSDRVAIFSYGSANMLYPSLIAKRYFERALLRAVGMKPPTDVGALLARAGDRLSAAQQSELRAILLDLDALAIPAHEGGPSRITPARFLSIWRRIDAILDGLGERR